METKAYHCIWNIFNVKFCNMHMSNETGLLAEFHMIRCGARFLPMPREKLKCLWCERGAFALKYVNGFSFFFLFIFSHSISKALARRAKQWRFSFFKFTPKWFSPVHFSFVHNDFWIPIRKQFINVCVNLV